MQKYLKLSNLLNVLPEALALLAVTIAIKTEALSHICLLWLIYSSLFRLLWNSAIIIHGLGHTIAIALADRQLAVFNSTNILEHQSISSILKSLVPFQYIYVPIFSSLLSPLQRSSGKMATLSIVLSPYVTAGKSEYRRFKAMGGIILNLIVAITISSYFDNYLCRVFMVANLLAAFSSISDLEAFITGVADNLYCGNFGAIAIRKPDDEEKLLPERILNIVLQMGQETEIRGEQAGGGFVVGSRIDNSIFADNKVVFVGKKIVNRKRKNLTKSLEAAFAPIRNRAMSPINFATAARIKPLESTIMGVWHYRYATNGTAPSELETHWHEWMGARNREVWQFKDNNWVCKIKNVHHRITHNGDFHSWQIFDRQIDNTTLGLWLEQVLHTLNATKGDSPKIAGTLDLLVTQGMWYESVRLAYQLAIALPYISRNATSIESVFNWQQPTIDAPNTIPSDRDLNSWAEIFERSFAAELSKLKYAASYKIEPKSLKFSIGFQQSLVRAFKSHPTTEYWSPLQTISFIQNTLKAFFENDLYRATQIFISRAQGSFGLVTASTLEESELVLCAKGQPLSVGFNWSQGYMVYASERAAVERILSNQPQSFRLDLNHRSGEVAKVGAKDITVYSLSHQQKLSRSHLQDRWISMAEVFSLSYEKPSSSHERDPVAHDINSIPSILHKIQADWKNPTSLNRRSADYLVNLFIQKVHRFEKRQWLMFRAGVPDKIKEMPAVDLLITGEENSLWLGERFAQDLKVIFPSLNVVTISANQILQQLEQDFEQLNLGKDSIVFAITQSGQTFSTIQVIDVFDRLSNRDIIGELFILTGELSSFADFTKGKGGSTTTNRSSFADGTIQRHCRHGDRLNKTRYKSTRSRIFVNGSGRRTAEPASVAVAAARQTLTELLFYLAKQLRNNFSNCDPLGMSLTTKSLMLLSMMKEDFLNRSIVKVIGTNTKGEPIKSSTNQALIKNGRYWANHVTETPLSWAIHALYIFISVGWVIPFNRTLPLIKTISGLLFSSIDLPTRLIQLLAPVITFADIAIYIFGAWLWTLAIRYFQGRQLLARIGKRTLIIGDVSWVHQLLQAYVSKLFALSYGIATIEVHSANPQNHLLHNFGHRIVRGILVWLGIPDGRRGRQQQIAENAVNMTGKQINGVKNFGVGAEIMTILQNSQIVHHNFAKAIVLDNNTDSIYLRYTTLKQKEQLEKLRESCFGSFERLLASYVFFWAFAKKVASFPFLKYEYWKSQSRTKVMTTAAPVAGFNPDRLNRSNKSAGSTYRKID